MDDLENTTLRLTVHQLLQRNQFVAIWQRVLAAAHCDGVLDRARLGPDVVRTDLLERDSEPEHY